MRGGAVSPPRGTTQGPFQGPATTPDYHHGLAAAWMTREEQRSEHVTMQRAVRLLVLGSTAAVASES